MRQAHADGYIDPGGDCSFSRLYRLVLRHEGLHYEPGDEVGDAAVTEHHEVAGRLA